MRHLRLFAHLVWTTRSRAPIITAPLADFLIQYLPRIAIQERASVLEIGILTAHVHLLLQLEPVTDIPKLVQRFKGGSAAIAAKEGISSKTNPLRWTKGYSLTSVSEQAIEKVRDYVRTQPSRHPHEIIPEWPSNTRRFTDTLAPHK